MNNTQKLSIDSEIFAQVRSDFDNALLKTVGNMISKDCDHAEITLKVKIDFNEVSEERNGVFRRVVRPEFEHQVSTAMSFKGKLTGSYKEDCELICDEHSEKYALKLRGGKQLHLFEEGGTE